MSATSKILSVCLISPYVPKHFGGGERYFFSVAEYLSKGHRVVVGIPSETELSVDDQHLIREAYERFLDLDLQFVEFVATPLFTSQKFLDKVKWTSQFDVMYYVTDGSFFFSLAKRNILHIQVPFKHQLSLFDRLKLLNWQIKNTNSIFTKQVIERVWETKVSKVHQPFVDTNQFLPGKRKEKIILNVGRFFTGLHTKRQDVLVKAFKKMCKDYPSEMAGWRLILVGPVEDQEYADRIQEMAQGFPIQIIHNASQEALKNLFSRAKIYWHATGYEVDEYLHPEKMEHFGITTIEAMASGCVPIVINKGGQKEIIEHGVSGYLWNERDALIEKTLACIKEEVDMADIAQHARERASTFSPESFYRKLDTMVDIEPIEKDEISSQVSVVIPNYNGQRLLEKNLPAVLRCLRNNDEIVIVDDASTDNSVEWLVQYFSLDRVEDRAVIYFDLFKGSFSDENRKIDITVLKNVDNQRFAISSNRGVKQASHDLILLLNSDVKPHKEILDVLVPYFTESENRKQPRNVFAVGCHEIEKDSQGKQISGGKNRLWFERGLFHHSRAKRYSTGETAWASGGSAMFDKRKWLELKGFDPKFKPAYWEDTDLSYRAKKMGWSVWFDVDALVDHNHETTNKTAFGEQRMQVMSIKNAIVFTLKNGSLLQRLQFLMWLPYHLTITNRKMNGTFRKGMWLCITQLLD